MSEATCNVQCTCIKNKQPKFKKGDFVVLFNRLYEIHEYSSGDGTALVYGLSDSANKQPFLVYHEEKFSLATEKDVIDYLSRALREHKHMEVQIELYNNLSKAMKGF